MVAVAGGAHTRHHHAELLEVLLHDPQRVEQRRQARPRRCRAGRRGRTGMSSSLRSRSSIPKQRGAAMSSRLIPPEPRRQVLHRLNDLVRLLGRQADREGVHVGELLEQHRLAFHHRQRPLWGRCHPARAPPVPVGDDGHGVLLDRERERPVPVLLDRQAHARHARRVGHREVVTGANRHLALDLDLATQVASGRSGPRC